MKLKIPPSFNSQGKCWKSMRKPADDPQCRLLFTCLLTFHISNPDCSTANPMQPHLCTTSQKLVIFSWTLHTEHVTNKTASIPYGSFTFKRLK